MRTHTHSPIVLKRVLPDWLGRLKRRTLPLWEETMTGSPESTRSTARHTLPLSLLLSYSRTHTHARTLVDTHTHAHSGMERARGEQKCRFGAIPTRQTKMCKAWGYHSNRLMGHWFGSQCNLDAGSKPSHNLRLKPRASPKRGEKSRA